MCIPTVYVHVTNSEYRNIIRSINVGSDAVYYGRSSLMFRRKQNSTCGFLFAGCFLSLPFESKYGGSTIFRNFGELLSDYIALQPRRWYPSISLLFTSLMFYVRHCPLLICSYYILLYHFHFMACSLFISCL
jgi:hypothetical protein